MKVEVIIVILRKLVKPNSVHCMCIKRPVSWFQQVKKKTKNLMPVRNILRKKKKG